MNEGKNVIFFEIAAGIKGLRIRRRLNNGVRVRENTEGGVVDVNGALVVPLGLFGEDSQELGWNEEKGFKKARVLLRESHTEKEILYIYIYIYIYI